MSDLISRADAIKAIDDLPNCYNGWSDTYDKAYIISTLEEVPSVSADAVHGKWQRFNDEYGTYWTGCSNCKGDIPKDKYGIDMYTDFCPNCGARMKGGDSE